MNEIYKEMRKRAFTTKPEDIRIILENNQQVYAAVVDMNIKGNLVSLVCIFDGSVSLYYSNGKCDIGLGKKEKIKKAAISFLISSGQCIHIMNKTVNYSGETENMKVYLFTKAGIYLKEISISKPESKEEKFLNFLVNNVLSAIDGAESFIPAE
ncbi:MAG TPA: hypothetical protein VIL99_14065 [Ignavibacteria bacterium]